MTQKNHSPEPDTADELLELEAETEVPEKEICTNTPEHPAENVEDFLSGTCPSCNADLRTAIRLYSNPNISALFMMPDYTIVYYTRKAVTLFEGYYKLGKMPFFNIFARSLDQDQLRDLYASLRSQDQGFTWTGTLRHKTKNTKTMFTKTNILPLFDTHRQIAGYLALFEDITNRYFAQLRSTFSAILEAAKLKDNDTGLHNERVNHYSRKLAEYVHNHRIYPQVDLDFVENIGFLAAMHDVGKIGTPDYILQKPGPLTELEWAIMREHTVNGTFILSSYPDPMAKEIALSHHEWWNGYGYPFKLEKEMIPLAARIVTIADVYDALRMKRTYKNEFTHQHAMQKIIANSGTQFDPVLIDCLKNIHESFASIWNLMRDTEGSRLADRDRGSEVFEVI